ncbi:zinc-ribbon domain protein [uncultured archaeon]|nr:zinc-ribbon domain protein [uncultured archaeon]
MDAGGIQKRMSEIQSNMTNDASFQSALGKLFSGRPGYKPVIETKQVVIKCKSCGKIMEDGQKFCDECGTRVEVPQKH